MLRGFYQTENEGHGSLAGRLIVGSLLTGRKRLVAKWGHFRLEELLAGERKLSCQT